MKTPSKLVLHILQAIVRSKDALNQNRVNLAFALLAIPTGLVWFLSAVTFPDNNLVAWAVGGLSALLFMALYLLILVQVLRGRWTWFANENGQSAAPSRDRDGPSAT
jgi:hypothetical protein